MRGTFVETLMELAGKDKNIELITGDLGFGVLKPYWEKYPAQFTNAGIAEQNMMGVAAGMAIEGKNVFAYSIGNFPTIRCLEQIRNDCAYHDANVKVVCVGGGFVYGSLGMSHHATEDISLLRSLPGVTVVCPADALEARYATKAIAQHKGTCYLRLGRGGEMKIHDSIENFELGKAIKVKEGNKAAVFFIGGIADQAYKAVCELNDIGISTALVSFHTVKPIDKDMILEYADKCEVIVTCEEHNIIGGLGSAVAEVMAEAGTHARLVRVGLSDVYSSVVGSQEYLRNYYNMNSDAVVTCVKKYL